jgi:DNA-binding CsgD family transcriptional regulator
MNPRAIEMYREHNTHLFNPNKSFSKDDIETEFSDKSNIFNSIEDGISILDTDYNIISINFTLRTWFSHKKNIVGKKCYKIYHDRNAPCEKCPIKKTMAEGIAYRDIVSYYIKQSNVSGWHELQGFPILDGDKVVGVAEYVKDITYEVDLYSKISEISHQMDNFKEQNELLKMYLDQTRDEKDEIENNISNNVKKYVKPLIRQIKDSCMERPIEYDLVSFLETLFDNIITPYLDESALLEDFTSRELQIMSAIKGGKSSKEIADIMCLSTKTIDFHRSNIRKKLNLERGKGNLRSYLIGSRMPLE